MTGDLKHVFFAEVAEDVGVNGAILFHNILFWCEKNYNDKRNIYNGTAYMYNTIKDFAKQFTYLTEKQIRSAIKTLEEKKYIKSNYLAINKYNRVKYYTISENGIWYSDILPRNFNNICEQEQETPLNLNCPTGQMELPHRANGIDPQGKSNCPTGQMELPHKANGIDPQGKSNCPTGQMNTDIKANIKSNIKSEENDNKTINSFSDIKEILLTTYDEIKMLSSYETFNEKELISLSIRVDYDKIICYISNINDYLKRGGTYTNMLSTVNSWIDEDLKEESDSDEFFLRKKASMMYMLDADISDYINELRRFKNYY